jgi:hypothetical protein
MVAMGMRTECRHYESRTYGHGETVRKCRLDLAPEAPWRCPEGCPAFEKRRFDAAWQYGSLTGAMAPTPTPEPAPLDASAAALLDEAEDIVNAAGAEALAELDRKAAKKRFRRKRR